MTVCEILGDSKGKLVSSGPELGVFQAVQRMSEAHVGSLMVLNEDGTLAGIVTERDVFSKVLLAEKNPREIPVGSIMSTQVVSVTCETSAVECMELMSKNTIRHLPVIHEGKPAGVVSIRDLIRHFSGEKDRLINNLQKYISGSL